ncbi:hypothetical protein LLG10_03725, partial [bacterium]|nr:hypothetical protein [bacterium]
LPGNNTALLASSGTITISEETIVSFNARAAKAVCYIDGGYGPQEGNPDEGPCEPKEDCTIESSDSCKEIASTLKRCGYLTGGKVSSEESRSSLCSKIHDCSIMYQNFTSICAESWYVWIWHKTCWGDDFDGIRGCGEKGVERGRSYESALIYGYDLLCK